MLNKAIITGRLTHDPDYRETSGRIPVAMMRVAVDRDYKSKETGERTTDFFNVTAWRGLADFAVAYLTKGTKIEVDGRLEDSTWKDRDGNTRHSVTIIAENIYFAGDRKTPPKPGGAEEQDGQQEDDVPIHPDDMEEGGAET